MSNYCIVSYLKLIKRKKGPCMHWKWTGGVLPSIFNSSSLGIGVILSTHSMPGARSALYIHCIIFIFANVVGGRSLSLFHIWGNWGSEQVTNLITVTKLLNGGARAQAKVTLTQGSYSSHPGLQNPWVIQTLLYTFLRSVRGDLKWASLVLIIWKQINNIIILKMCIFTNWQF